MDDVASIARAIREASLPAWLFVNQFHRDEIADELLGVVHSVANSRPWACVVAADGTVTRIVHAVEPRILDHLPGAAVRYVARGELLDALGRILAKGTRVAAQVSSSFPVCSLLDHGTALLLEAQGIHLVSSEDLVVDCLGTSGEEGAASQERAIRVLEAAVREAWGRVESATSRGEVVREGEVGRWLSDYVTGHGLKSDSPPIVAVGPGSADPHYAPEGDGRELAAGSVLQLDLWGKEPSPGAVYGDISWIAVMGSRPTSEQQRVFEAVVEAREAVIAFIGNRLAAGAPVEGREVDEAARERIAALGLASGLRHRTGHAIGARVHGYGVNLDSVEFPDHRRLREGSCFSVEPGIYLEGFGMRTEVDARIEGGRLVVGGGPRQERLLTLGSGPRP